MDRASEIAVSMEEGSPPGEQQALAPKNPNKNQAFFSLVAGVKKLLGELESKVHGKNADPPSLKIIFFGDVLAFDEEKKRDLIEERTDEIQALIKQAKLKLEEMLQEASDENAAFSAADRQMRKNMHATLAKRTDALAGEFLALKQAHRKDNEDEMLRHVKIVAEKKPNGEEHTEEEMTLMAAQCLETGTSPFMTAMAQTALEDVLRKHEAIVRIERNIEEVAALFNDLAILVTAQGEQLDRIDDNVTRAYAATKKGVVELQKANDNARKNRKRMCCIWWCLVIALVAILFPMLASAIFGI